VNPFEPFENPAMAQQRMIYQLQMEQQQFWFPINARPPMNDFERQQAVSLLGQRRARLAMLQGDAMFLSSQGFGQLLFLVNQEINAVVNAQSVFLNAMQGPQHSQNPGYQTPAAPAYPAPSPPAYPPPSTRTPPFSGPDDLQDFLAESSASQQRFQDILLGNCVHCHKPREGASKCPRCGMYQNS
jgi:hypothetical protein